MATPTLEQPVATLEAGIANLQESRPTKADFAQQVLVAISDALHLVQAYSGETGKVEVERLYSVGTSFSTFLAALQSAEAFTIKPAIQQRDMFFDLRRGDHWLMSATDHYVRLREERTHNGSFIRGEVKKAYPGPSWNPNARPAKDCVLAEEEIPAWRRMLEALGLRPEREYLKRRVGCVSIEKFEGMSIELEIDHFADDSCNGVLSGQAFVSSSVEVPGADQQKAELALANVLRVLSSLGVPFVACAGSYEDYFYRKMPLPSVDPSTSA